MFSLFPQSNSSGTFQKVTQVIPVKVSIDDLQGLNLVPGMNVTVRSTSGRSAGDLGLRDGTVDGAQGDRRGAPMPSSACGRRPVGPARSVHRPAG